MKAKNFKEFFDNKFFWEDRKHAQVHMPVRLLEIAENKDITKYMPISLVEMAMKGEIAKTPIRIDKDDLDFLYQFPPKYWGKALHARYHDDLYQALKTRQEGRGISRNKVKDVVQKALMTQNFSNLTGILPNDKIEELRKNYGPEWASEYKRKGERAFNNAAHGAADDFSYYHSEEETPNSPISEEPKLYRFKAPGSNVHKERFETFKAKPFINRLIHKLEKTRGLKHAGAIGDELVRQLGQHGHETGQYGYDLDQVKEGRPKQKKGDTEIPHSTGGMQMPTYDTTVDRVKDFLATNAHRIYGSLPGDSDYQGDATKVTLPNGEVKEIKGWHPVEAGASRDWEQTGVGTGHLYDAFIKSKYQDPLEQRYFTLLGNANGSFTTLSGNTVDPRRFGNRSEQSAEAKRLAIADVQWLKEHGDIKGPPIPGHEKHAQGIPFKDVSKNSEAKQIVHLPHFDHEITSVGDDGREVKQTVKMPYVHPAGYFRSIGILPEDFERDDEGKIIIDANGKPKLSQETKERAVGYQKDYLPVHPDEYDSIRSAARKKGVYAAGALHVNQNTAGLNTLDYGHHSYSTLAKQVFGPDDPGEPRPETAMKMFSLDDNGIPIRKKGASGQFYEDIIAGIRSCLKSNSCGGATQWERSIATNNIADIHQIVVQKMQQNLRDPDMLTQAGRKNFALNQTSTIMQQDHEGGGTRRKRILDPSLRSVSMDATTRSSDTGEESSSATQDIVAQRQRERPGLGPNDVVNRRAMSGSHDFPYDIRNMRNILEKLRNEAGEADKNANIARERSRVEVGQEILGLLSKSFSDKSAVSQTLHALFMKMFQSLSTPPQDVQKAADEAMKTLSDKAKTTEQLVTAFSNHEMVRKFTDSDELPSQQSQQPDQPPADLPHALEKLQDTYLDAIPQEDGKPNPTAGMRAALMGGQVARVVANNATNDPVDREKIQKALQDHINKFLGVESQPAAVTPVAQPQSPVTTDPKRPIPLPQNTPLANAAKVIDLPAQKVAQETPNWRDLYSQKAFLALAFHKAYLRDADDASLQNLKGWIEKKKSQISENEYRQALLNIEKEIQTNKD